MTERKIKITLSDHEEYGKWVDNVVLDNIPYAVVITDEGKVIGADFGLITVLP